METREKHGGFSSLISDQTPGAIATKQQRSENLQRSH